jgi:hypothetical protein
MNPDSGMSPEDQATFEQLAAALSVEASAAAAGPPRGEQLAALRHAVSQRRWFWAPLLARLRYLPSTGATPSA